MAKITDVLKKSKKPIFSIEIIPPNRGNSLDGIFRAIDTLKEFDPKFINVTQHQPHVHIKEIDGEIHRISQNKKPGTVGLSAAIKHKFNIDPVPHLICGGFSKYQIEDMLIDLEYLEIENMFVVRGDPISGREFIPAQEGYRYSSEMIKQISDMNKGIYTAKTENAVKTNFCIGAAGYPEKHFEAMNLDNDLKRLKHKIDQGAEYIITQMFFDFNSYKKFVEKAREMGITVPIIPGIKPIVREKFLKTIPRAFFINIPIELVNAFEAAKTPKEEFEAGTKYVSGLVEKLLDYGVPGIHLFTMGSGKSAHALMDRVFK